MLVAVAGGIEHVGNEHAGVRAADVNHAGLERAENGVAVIQIFLGGHALGHHRRAPGVLNGTPEWTDVVGKRTAGIIRRVQGLVDGVGFVPTTGFDGVEEPLDVVGNGHVVFGGQFFENGALFLGKLGEFTGQDGVSRGRVGGRHAGRVVGDQSVRQRRRGRACGLLVRRARDRRIASVAKEQQQHYADKQQAADQQQGRRRFFPGFVISHIFIKKRASGNIDTRTGVFCIWVK